VTLPGTYREIDKMPVSGSDALVAWVKHARPALERTAKTYHATITYKELSEEVQVESGIRTRRLLQHWIGDVLGTAAARLRARQRSSPSDTSRPMCPTCHLMLPVSGQCDNCS
jgi:hypothetical protein